MRRMLFARVISYIWFGRVLEKILRLYSLCRGNCNAFFRHCKELFGTIYVGLRLDTEYMHFIKTCWFICCLRSVKPTNSRLLYRYRATVACVSFFPTLIIILHNEFLDLKSDTWRIFYLPFFPTCCFICLLFSAWILWFSDRFRSKRFRLRAHCTVVCLKWFVWRVCIRTFDKVQFGCGIVWKI